MQHIRAGDELTISYTDEDTWMLPRNERQKAIKAQFGFDCICSWCQQSPELTKASDGRRLLLAATKQKLENTDMKFCNAKTFMRDCAKALWAFRDEDYYSDFSHMIYRYAAEISATLSDNARSSEFGKLMVWMRTMCEGEDYDGIDEDKVYITRPQNFGIAGLFSDWKTEIGEGLVEGGEGIKRWLWARCQFKYDKMATIVEVIGE